MPAVDRSVPARSAFYRLAPVGLVAGFQASISVDDVRNSR